MGKFDHILLCSDWDGTITHQGSIVQKNIEAIRYFQENGGLFTICSGRYHNYLKQFESLIKPNTYTVCLNGALILNTDSGEILHRGFTDEHLFSVIDRLLALEIPYQTVTLYGEENFTEYTAQAYHAKKEALRCARYYKALLKTDTPEHGARGAQLAREIDLMQYDAIRSWNVSLEIIHRSNSKGMAVKRLQEKTGARLLVTVGDFENDISMLRAADIGFAVDNATDYVRSFADRVTVPASEGAIAAIVAELECELLGSGRR
jgi:Cof subfamily protein (haloacid dehalogenase superfamily)